MSSYTRKLTETIRVAEHMKKALRSTAENNEYERGLYNGFNMILTLLTGLEYTQIDKKQKRKKIK